MALNWKLQGFSKVENLALTDTKIVVTELTPKISEGWPAKQTSLSNIMIYWFH